MDTYPLALSLSLSCHHALSPVTMLLPSSFYFFLFFWLALSDFITMFLL
jgi:hypothetical protein